MVMALLKDEKTISTITSIWDCWLCFSYRFIDSDIMTAAKIPPVTITKATATLAQD